MPLRVPGFIRLPSFVATPTVFPLPPGAVDGNAWCEAALVDIAARVWNGEKVRVVFDIDNTLSDTRARTLKLAHLWDKANGTHYFDKLKLDAVLHDAEQTAKALGLPPSVVSAFDAYWQVAFWDPASLKFDKRMVSTLKLAAAAKKAGADVVFLTGRVEANHAGTVRQLRRLGLRWVRDDHVFCKPTLRTYTPKFKREMIDRWKVDRWHIEFFFTEGRRDIRYLQAADPSLPCVLLDSSQGGSEQVRSDTPVFRRVF